MPVHDWTRIDAGVFHDFRLGWVVTLAGKLNTGGLPSQYMAMLERDLPPSVPDDESLDAQHSRKTLGGIAVATAPPTARLITRLEANAYAKRADRIVIRRGLNEVVAIIEIVSPGNKSGRQTLRTFVKKAFDIINRGVNLVVVDLFPPTPRDPFGIHKAIWDEFSDEPFDMPPNQPLIAASYLAGEIPTAYVESVGIGDPLPSLPIFLSETSYVPAPLEATYTECWEIYPAFLKKIIDPGSAR